MDTGIDPATFQQGQIAMILTSCPECESLISYRDDGTYSHGGLLSISYRAATRGYEKSLHPQRYANNVHVNLIRHITWNTGYKIGQHAELYGALAEGEAFTVPNGADSITVMACSTDTVAGTARVAIASNVVSAAALCGATPCELPFTCRD